MNKGKKKGLFIFLIIVVFLLVGVIITYLVVIKPMPVALVSEYGLSALWEEGTAMNDCAECHDGEEFHSCDTCHDDHGAVELAGVGFYAVIELTGDVPDPSFVRINEILPNQDESSTHITLIDLLMSYGVDSFESVTLITSDGGLTTIEYQYLDETAMLVPYVDGARFITETIHVSAWMKGINRIVVVGSEKPLTIDGEATSIGRLLLGDTVRVSVEESDVMLVNDDDNMSHAIVANWTEGVLLTSLLRTSSPESIILTDSSGNTTELDGSEIEGAIIGIVKDKVTLILPERGRSAWPTNIIEIESN